MSSVSKAKQSARGRGSSRGGKHHGNRHRRSEEARQAVLEAADGLLAEVGFAALTIEGIAARAGVGKQTIYRWWPSKADILMDAFLDDAIQELVPPESGDAGTDLRSHLSNLAEFLTRSDAGSVFRALTGQIQHDPRMADRFRLAYLARQREIDRAPLRLAVERGELPADLDVELAVDQLVGPIYYRVLVTGEAVTRQFTDLLVDRFLRSAGRHITAPAQSEDLVPRGRDRQRRVEAKAEGSLESRKRSLEVIKPTANRQRHLKPRVQ